jgi:hypothetical protein
MAALTKAQKQAIDAKRDTLIDLERKLELIEAGKIMAGGLLMQIRDEQLWSVDPDRAYASFEDYTEQRWGFGKREAERKIDAFCQVKSLQDAGVNEADLPSNPWQARDITVLANKTDTATAARTWVTALTDARDPQKNPTGRFTGVWLKGYVDAALKAAGAQRRQGTSRARAGTATQASNGKVVHVVNHTRQVGGSPAPAAGAPTAQAAPAAGVQVPSTNGLGVLPPQQTSVEVLFELADDVKKHRLHLGNPIARKALFDGVTELLAAITAEMIEPARVSPEADPLCLASENLHRELNKAVAP